MKHTKTEHEILTKVLWSTCGKKTIEEAVKKIKAVLKENNLDSPGLTTDIFRLVELTLDPRKDKHYGKY